VLLTMSTWEKIETDYSQAYRAGDKMPVEVLRLLKTALMNAEIEKRSKVKDREAKLVEEEVVAVIKKQGKSLEESIVLFQQGGRQDLVDQTQKEVEILKKYLPEELSESAVREVVKTKIAALGADGPQAFGRVMSEVMKELKGQAGGDLVSKLVKELLG